MVTVMIYNTGTNSPNFNMMQSVMPIATLARVPRKVALVQRYVNTIPQSFRFPKSCEISRLLWISVICSPSIVAYVLDI